jgi:hypothetical protein
MARDLGLIRGFELIDYAFTFIRCNCVFGVSLLIVEHQRPLVYSLLVLGVTVRIARLHIGDVVVRHAEFQRIELLLFPSRHLLVVVGLLDCFQLCPLETLSSNDFLNVSAAFLLSK